MAAVDETEVVIEETVRLMRAALQRITSLSHRDVDAMQTELNRRDADIQELRQENQQLRSKLADMTRRMTQLAEFKKSVTQHIVSASREEGLDADIDTDAPASSSFNSSPSPFDNSLGVYNTQVRLTPKPEQNTRVRFDQSDAGSGILFPSSSILSLSQSQDAAKHTMLSPQQPPPLDQADPSTQISIDGREFFKLARKSLSYDEFTALLWNVKAYNNREQTRQKTMENLDALFGRHHRVLYEQFERLLGR